MMLRELLWIYEAKLQYERQKAQGMAGFIALLSVIFVAWKWNDWFYPFFDKIGLVALTAKLGLRHESPVITIIMIGTAILAIAVGFALLALVGVLLQALFLMIGYSKVGNVILGILCLPMVVWVMFFQGKTKKHSYVRQYKEDPDLQSVLTSTAHLDGNERKLHLYLHQLERKANVIIPDHDRRYSDSAYLLINYDGHWIDMERELPASEHSWMVWDKDFKYQSFTVEQAIRFLNRVPASEDDISWLLGYNTQDKQVYALLPNPLPHPFSKGAEADLTQGLRNNWTFKNMDYYSEFSVISIPLMLEWNTSEFVLKMNKHEQRDRDTLKYTNIRDYSSIFMVHSNFVKPLFRRIQRDTTVKSKLRSMIIAHYILPVFLKKQWDESLHGYDLVFEEVTNSVTNYSLHRPLVKRYMKFRANDGLAFAQEWMKEEHRLEG